MQSDTVIGIVGAVVLVAVMIGVFAYEYNNAPAVIEDDGMTEDQEKMAKFNATYPTLDAFEDLDRDNVPNWNDTDIDEDGTPNEQDNTTSFTHPDITETVPQRTPANDPAGTFEVFVGKGAIGGSVTVTWTTTSVPTGTPPDNLVVSISGIPCTSGTGTATCDLTGAEPGTYTVTVKHSQPLAQAKSFTGSYTVDY